jgi:hypothetical protein
VLRAEVLPEGDLSENDEQKTEIYRNSEWTDNQRCNEWTPLEGFFVCRSFGEQVSCLDSAPGGDAGSHSEAHCCWYNCHNVPGHNDVS